MKGLRGLKLPPRKVCAALVLAMLGFGVLIGEAGRPSVKDVLAASTRPHVKVVLPASTPSAEVAPSEASEPPESEATPTPAAVAPRSSAPSSSSSPSKQGTSAGEGSATRSSERTPDKKLPAIKHVFVIMLSDQPYAAVFGPESVATYLTRKLLPQGALLARYDAISHEQLPNEIALLSGQGATAETALDCPQYGAILPTGLGADEQVLGAGCVYPASTQTLPGQLSAKHLSWGAYIEGMDETGGASGPCAHPVLGQGDPTAVAGSGAYATFINPIVYFDALAAAPSCAADDVGIDRLKHDLADPKLTPSFSYIAPSRCADGDPTPCAAGAPAGLVPADAFLKRVVTEITASKAYKQAGLLVITVDEAPSSGEFADSSSCCGQPVFPNLPAALSETATGRPRGGGSVGALLLSPFIKGPETSQEPYNHFSLLATIEQIFGLKRLGYAALAGVKPLEASIFSEVSSS